ncbi:MAG: Ig-like domain-containing protein [Candidatus Sulfotelmatobacter sp.]
MSDTDYSFCRRWLILILFLPSIGCSGTLKAPPPSNTSGTISVKLNQSSVTISAGAQQQFTAAVTGTTNTAVTWSVDSVAGGSSSVGTINAAGLYAAPEQAGTHVVTATSVADTTKSASATVTVAGLVAITPTTLTISTGATQQFTATVQGQSNAQVAWSVDGIAGGNSSVGTITSSGLYTAPSQAGTHTVAATAKTNPSASASAPVTVFSFALSPGSGIVLNPSATQQFTATIQGLTNTAVTWSVDGVAGGNSSAGTITTSGLYTAPNAIGAHAVTATSVANPPSALTSDVTVINVSQSAVLTYHNDDARDGAYLQEVTLNPSNVNSSQFGKLLSYPVDGQIYAQPLYLPQVNIPNKGTYNVVYVATQNNSVYAFDADATSSHPATLWHVNLGTPVPVYDAYGPWPAVGILSTPVIDATTNTMYVVAEVNGANPPFWLHALDATTGADKMNPVGINGSYSGDSLSFSCYQRMGLALDPVNNWIYIAFGSCSHGWLFAYDKSSLEQTAIFDDTNGAAGGGLWASGGAPAIDDTTGDAYLMSGVDSGDQEWITGSTMVGYNDAFLRLSPNDLSVLDYFSPDNNYTLAVNDVDLGSGANVLVPGSSSYPHELVGGGKDGNIFVINRDSMGGFNDTSNNVLQTVLTGTQQYNNIFDTPVYWNGSLYFHCSQDVLRAFSWNASAEGGQQLSTSSTSAGSAVYSTHGATPSLSANGTNNGIIWDIDNSAYVGTNPVASGPAVLHAYNATNLANELYNSAQAGSRDQAGLALKFTVPTIANGRVFVPTANELDIYGLLNP